MVSGIVINKDTVAYVKLKTVIISEKGDWGIFESWERKRLEKKVRKTLPLAKALSRELSNRHERLFSNDSKIRTKESNDLEKYLRDTYTKTLKDLTIGEGKVLLKLIHRENNMSPYETLKLLKNERQANFWSDIGNLFGTDLHEEWDPIQKDRVLNQVAIKVENE